MTSTTKTTPAATATTPAAPTVKTRKPRAKADIPADETKGQKFVRIANSRVPNALEAINIVGGLANPQNYEYTPEQAAKVVELLRAAIDQVETKFKGEGFNNDTKAKIF